MKFNCLEGDYSALKVLVIRLSGIGDLAFSIPLLNKLKHDTCRITFLTESQYEPLLSLFQADRIISFNPSKRSLVHLGLKLLMSGYDRVIDLQNDERTRSLHGIINTKQLLIYPKGFKIHVVDEFLNLLGREESAPNRLKIPPGLIHQARTWLGQRGITQPYIFIQPFTGYPYKNWGLDNFIEFAEYWPEHGYQVVFGGGPGDAAKLKAVRFSVAAGEDILTSLGLAMLSSLIVGGDTGLLHLAVAAGSKVLMIMIVTSPEVFGPYRHLEWAVRNPESVETVISKAKELLIGGEC
jgi:ADP-heptose:LPS heptosyltransferase